MPLVRLEVRNEFGAGQTEHCANREDPKAVLDGLAVSGLVGILRQLGDLAEFAAEVFHGLQEQVMATSSRSRKLMARVHHIEATLPPLEKVVLAQTSHIHFAYTPGSEWHPHIRNETNHFISSDLPQFIMNSYEECRGPPRLHLLDKFDTGGPGSCLKRYSDPTFFKRASATPDEASTEKSQRDRKARRSKKKRSGKESGFVSHGASTSSTRDYCFIPPIVDGQTSPSHTASTVDPGAKYNFRDSLNSFDSRIESGYIECVIRPSFSIQAEEQESTDSPPFNIVQNNDASDSVSPDEHAGFVDDRLLRSSLLEQMTSTSSCVTWDEKAEILEPRGQENDMDETLYTRQNETDIDARGCGDGNSPIVHQKEILGDENIHESISCRNGIDEIDSEPDNYMDALNTIESESEIDLDYQTKRELERFSSISNYEGTDGMHELTVNSSDHHPPTIESHPDPLVSSNKEVLSYLPDPVLSESNGHEQILAPEVSSAKQGPSDLPNLFSSESQAFKQVTHVARECSTDNSIAIIRNSDVPDGSELEPAIAETSSSASRTTGIQDWSGDKPASNVSEPQESPTDVSSNSSVKIWTNGGLLGLMPSKPPDFTMASPVTRDSMNSSKATIVGPLDSAYGNAFHLHIQNGLSNSSGNDLKETTILGTGKVLPVAQNAKYRSAETSKDNDEDSSLVFGLGRRLLSNGFGRKVSDVDDNKFEPASSVDANVLEQRSEHTNQIVPETVFKEQFGYGSTESPTASPPLEHMKISFHPLDGSEASKLRLKFSNGTQSHERIRDLFPSFQLIPDANIRLRDYGSDSDDDTFGRSSPFMSDDCLSHHSESNSEQWEYGETAEGKDDEIYDALCGISSMELVPNSLELDGMPNSGCFDGGVKRENYGIDVESSICNPILDLPSFDAVKPALLKTNNDSDARNPTDSGYLADSSPMPPPLPPMQWRASNQHLDVVEDTPDTASEAFKQVLGVNLLGSATSQQSKPAPEGLQQTNAVPAIKPTVKEGEQKSNKQKELNHSPNGKDMDEREDFLQQIRTKSFNLRRTATEKSNTASGPPANVNVTTILEKANAIRQAVGSDDGEDDTWSDS